MKAYVRKITRHNHIPKHDVSVFRSVCKIYGEPIVQADDGRWITEKEYGHRWPWSPFDICV